MNRLRPLRAQRGIGTLAVTMLLLLVITIVATTVVWVTVTFLSPPTDRTRLLSFYKLVRPAGPGWRTVRTELNLPTSPDSLTRALVGWMLGCTFVYSALFGTGSFLYGRTGAGVAWLVSFVVTGVSMWRIMPGMWQADSAK